MALLENKQALFSWAVFFVRNISIDPKISQAITSKVEDVFSRFNEPTQVHLKLLATSWLIHYYILCSDDPEYYVWCNRQLRYLYPAYWVPMIKLKWHFLKYNLLTYAFKMNCNNNWRLMIQIHQYLPYHYLPR